MSCKYNNSMYTIEPEEVDVCFDEFEQLLLSEDYESQEELNHRLNEEYFQVYELTNDEMLEFYNQLLGIVEKMGGHISAHGNLHGIFLSVIVFHDSTYEKTRDIMNTLQELCGGEIQYHEYWVSKGFIPHSQASLENIDESKVLEIIGELQDDEYYSIDDEYHDLDDGGIING